MLSVSTGHHWRYLTDQVGAGRENYYTKATSQGEPPGVWNGAGAAKLGLSGEVTENQMAALYGHFVDPRDPNFAVPEGWDTAAKLGQAPRKFKSKEEILTGLLAREPNATPERVEELTAKAAKQERHPVAFIDLTFSPSKSVSVLHTSLRAQEAAAERDGRDRAAAMWRERAEAVEAAMWDGNRAMLDYMQREAGFSRVGYHGPRSKGGESVGRFVDANEWITASFFQHTSRPDEVKGEQPQLHIHNATLNRVECPDGTWRTLDSRAIHRVRGAGGALGERVMFESLVKRLGVDVKMRPDGKAREIVGIPKQVNDWFSARRAVITDRTATYVELFKQRKGRAPNNLELSRLATTATLKTRGGKLPKATTAAERVDRWADEVRTEVDTTLAKCATNALNRTRTEAATFRPAEVVENALAEVKKSRSEWSRYDLLRAIDQHLPDNLGGAKAADIERVREQLADRALNPAADKVGQADEVWRLTAPDLVAPPAELRRANGESMYRPHGAERYATRAQLSAEQQLEKAAQRPQGATHISPEKAANVLGEVNARLAQTGGKLGDDQAAALHGILTSGRPVEALVGPPGTGKSFTLGTLSELWEERLQHGRVFGLALAQNAAGVLADEGITRAANVTRWRAMQDRIDNRKANAAETAAWQLRRGDLMLIDESGMADTESLAYVQQRANDAGAKVVFVGDPRQLAAVGSGGAFSLVSEAGQTYQLDEVRRFHDDWERAASLRLRDGDTSVLPIYQRHGRIIDAGTVEDARSQVSRAWLADTMAGRPSTMVVDTNDDAAELSRRAQQELVDLGQVQTPMVKLADGNSVGVGDLIQTRRNDRTIKAADGTWIVNRHNLRVTDVDAEAGTVRGRRVIGTNRHGERLGAPISLPAKYVRNHAALGYAVTAHGVQGATLGDRDTYGTSHQIVSGRTGADAYLVGQTRGTGANIAYVVTDEGADWRTPDDIADAEAAARRDGTTRETPSALAVVSNILERYETDSSALARMREELAEAESMHRLGAIWTDVQDQLTTPRYEKIISDVLPSDQAAAVLDDDARGPLWRTLRGTELAGHDAGDVLATAAAARELHSADSIAQVLQWRITGAYEQAATPRGDSYTDRTIPARGPLGDYAMRLAEAMDTRTAELGHQAAEQQPQWAIQHLGAPPEEPLARAEWTQRAGRVAAYREQYDYTNDTDAIGRVPRVGQTEARAGWYAAWRALGEPAGRPDEAAMPDAELRDAVARYDREVEWAPDFVGEELQTSSETARLLREEAYLTRAKAERETDPTRARELHRVAAEWTALARDAAGERNQLDYIDQARGEWYVETADTREAADRARDELDSRGRKKQPQPEVTHDEAAQAETADKREPADIDNDRSASADVAAETHTPVVDAGVWWPEDLSQLEEPTDEIEAEAAQDEPVEVAQEAPAPTAETPDRDELDSHTRQAQPEAARDEAAAATETETVPELEHAAPHKTDETGDETEAREQEPAPVRLADQVERARQAREIIEARAAARDTSQEADMERQRRVAELDDEERRRERDRQGPSLSL